MSESATLEMAIKVIRACPDSISISLLQRHLKLGYRAACELMAQLVSAGVVTDQGEQATAGRYASKL